MSAHLCEQCGAENAHDAQFCTKCDFYLGWDIRVNPADESPLVPEDPVVRDSFTMRMPSLTNPLPSRPQPRPPMIKRPVSGRPAKPPAVTVETAEVVLDPHTGGSCDIRIRNTSSIVDGYTIEAPAGPRWLEIGHPEIRLLTDEESVTAVTVTVHPTFDPNVQRFTLPLQVRSVEDPTKHSDAEIVIVVPRAGGPVTVTAEPQVLRLLDKTTGRFRVRLDNTGSNYPQRYALSGADPERVVRFGFRPHVIEVPPRKVVFSEVRFDAPGLHHGQEANRMLTITAAGDEGRFDTVVNVLQQRSQAPADSPVRLYLEPSVTRLRDRTAAEVRIVVDNRRGSRDRRLHFSGRDPEGVVRFAFSEPQFHIRAGDQARLHVRVEAPLPRPGEECERPFTVICHDGTDESQESGSLVQSASASAITTARIDLEPDHVVVRNRRRGRFRVKVDNSRGALPLSVVLSGKDPEAALRFSFVPSRLDLPPGHSGWAAVNVEGRLPGGGQEVVRDITVCADDGTDSVEAAGKFTQSMSEIYPFLRLILTCLGGLLAVLGAVVPWFAERTYYATLLPALQGEVEDILDSNVEGKFDLVLEAVSQPATRALVLVGAAVMMLGILSAKGTITILAGFATAMVAIGYTVYVITEFNWGHPTYGMVLVVLGALIGIAGGFCATHNGGT